MSPTLASQLLYDSDQDILFEVDEIKGDSAWVTARVYKTVKDHSTTYEVWQYEWSPETNEEKSFFIQSFQGLEDAKGYARQLAHISKYK